MATQSLYNANPVNSPMVFNPFAGTLPTLPSLNTSTAPVSNVVATSSPASKQMSTINAATSQLNAAVDQQTQAKKTQLQLENDKRLADEADKMANQKYKDEQTAKANELAIKQKEVDTKAKLAGGNEIIGSNQVNDYIAKGYSVQDMGGGQFAVAPPASSSTSSSSTPSPAEGTVAGEQAKADQATKDYNDFATLVKNGTLPLSSAEELQVENLRKQYEDLKVQQAEYNKSVLGGTTVAGQRAGRSRYAGEMEAGNLAKVFSDGQAEIRKIQAAETKAISDLKQSLVDKKFEVATKAYSAVIDNIEKRKKVLQDTTEAAQKEVEQKSKTITEKLQQAKLQQDLAKGNMESFASGLINLDANGNVVMADDATIESTASAMGVTPMELLGVMRNKAYELSKLSAEDRKRELEIEKVKLELLSSQKVVTINGKQYMQDEYGNLTEPATPDALPDDTKINKAQNLISIVDELLADPALPHAVGPISSRIPTLRGGTSDFEAKVAQLKANLTIENMGIMKGVLSDSDMKVIASVATALDTKMSEQGFRRELKKIKGQMQNRLIQAGVSTAVDFDSWQANQPVEIQQKIDAGLANPVYGATLEERKKNIMEYLGGFNSDEQTSLKGTIQKVVSKPDGVKGGQCGRFVNQITGLGLGDSYASKMAKMDPTIKQPQPGMVFVMPYKDTGHTGFIVAVNNGVATVKDSNAHLDEKISTHQIPVRLMTGFAIA
jgi:hypothetical protein